MQQCEKRMQKGRTRVPATERSEESRGIRPAGGRGASAEPNTRDYLMETERRTLNNQTEPEQSRNSEFSFPSFHFPVFKRARRAGKEAGPNKKIGERFNRALIDPLPSLEVKVFERLEPPHSQKKRGAKNYENRSNH